MIEVLALIVVLLLVCVAIPGIAMRVWGWIAPWLLSARKKGGDHG